MPLFSWHTERSMLMTRNCLLPGIHPPAHGSNILLGTWEFISNSWSARIRVMGVYMKVNNGSAYIRVMGVYMSVCACMCMREVKRRKEKVGVCVCA